MAYKALYRKYRPDGFNSVVGQVAIIKTLQNIVKNDKISHAYLFSGPRGTGKTSVAKIFAKAINCLNPNDGMPCGECSVCTQIKDDQTNDIIEIDAASNNGVDEIRDLKSKINLVPTMCKYKVYIIDEVHMLSIGAFNALLKTLEEPPHHVVFILATTEMHKLPLTIISRCQNFNFKKITEEQMKIRLQYIADQEEINIEEPAIYEIAKVSDGGMRDAIGLLEQLASFTGNNITIKDVELLSSSVPRKDLADLISDTLEFDIEKIFAKVDQFYQDGKDFIKISEDMIAFLKDILLYKKASNYFESISTYNINEYQSLINKLNANLIYNYISQINQMVVDLKVSNHPKTIFEISLLKLVDEKGNNISNTLEHAEKVLDVSKKENLNEMPKRELSSEDIKKIDGSDSLVSNKPNYNNDHIKVENYNDTSQTQSKDESLEEIESIVECDDIEIPEISILPSTNIPVYKKIIINNTLASAKKELLADLKNKSGQLKTLLINKDFKQAATVLLDGKIVGVSENNAIYVYPYDVMVEKADNIIDEIESLITNISGRKYIIVNITEEIWSDVRPYYVNLMKENKVVEKLPEIDIKALRKKKKNKKKSKDIEEAINMFGEDLIEIK